MCLSRSFVELSRTRNRVTQTSLYVTDQVFDLGRRSRPEYETVPRINISRVRLWVLELGQDLIDGDALELVG